MHDTSIIFSLFLVFSGAAVIATLALFARQALLIAYILLGALLGPWALDVVSNPELIADIANVGILFYLIDGDRPNLIYRHRYRKYSAVTGGKNAD